MPRLFHDDFFSFIIDVVNWGLKWFSIYEIKGSEHTNLTKICLVNRKLLIIAKMEFGLTKISCRYVENVIILNDSKFFIFMIISLVCDAHHHKFIGSDFPHCVKSTLYLFQTIRLAKSLFNIVGFVGSFWIISQIISPKIPIEVIPAPKPCYH